jgi:hypothetical protein
MSHRAFFTFLAATTLLFWTPNDAPAQGVNKLQTELGDEQKTIVRELAEISTSLKEIQKNYEQSASLTKRRMATQLKEIAESSRNAGELASKLDKSLPAFNFNALADMNDGERISAETATALDTCRIALLRLADARTKIQRQTQEEFHKTLKALRKEQAEWPERDPPVEKLEKLTRDIGNEGMGTGEVSKHIARVESWLHEAVSSQRKGRSDEVAAFLRHAEEDHRHVVRTAHTLEQQSLFRRAEHRLDKAFSSLRKIEEGVPELSKLIQKNFDKRPTRENKIDVLRVSDEFRVFQIEIEQIAAELEDNGNQALGNALMVASWELKNRRMKLEMIDVAPVEIPSKDGPLHKARNAIKAARELLDGLNTGELTPSNLSDVNKAADALAKIRALQLGIAESLRDQRRALLGRDPCFPPGNKAK